MSLTSPNACNVCKSPPNCFQSLVKSEFVGRNCQQSLESLLWRKVSAFWTPFRWILALFSNILFRAQAIDASKKSIAVCDFGWLVPGFLAKSNILRRIYAKVLTLNFHQTSSGQWFSSLKCLKNVILWLRDWVIWNFQPAGVCWSPLESAGVRWCWPALAGVGRRGRRYLPSAKFMFF